MRGPRIPKIFISYAREDARRARKLYFELLQAGCDPWLDLVKLAPGARWKREILRALKTSDFCVILLSQHSLNKQGFIQNEIREALDLLGSYPDDRPFVIPARLGDVLIEHPQLAELQRVDLFKNWGAGIDGILRTVISQIGPHFRINRTLADRSDVLLAILGIFETELEIPRELLRPDADLYADLALDSIHTVSMALAFEEELGIAFNDSDLVNVNTVSEAADSVFAKLQEQGAVRQLRRRVRRVGERNQKPP